MRVAELMTPDPIVIGPDETIERAAELMGRFVTPFEADMKISFSGSSQVDHLTGTLAGMFIGKKD